MLDLVGKMMAWEEGTLSEDETVQLFQSLIDSGTINKLQGMYGRYAQDLINQGFCTARKAS